jgi:hypothetical protein
MKSNFDAQGGKDDQAEDISIKFLKYNAIGVDRANIEA